MSTGDVSALEALGWNERLAAIVAADARPARVGRVDRGRATVFTASGTEFAGLGGHRVATGDWVVLTDGNIAEVLPRHSEFVRGDTIEGVARQAQVVAANIDTVFVVQSLATGTNLRRLERELVLAFESGATPVVVLTKADLVTTEQADANVARARAAAASVDVVVTSARSGAGIDRLRAYARGGRTVALIGASGVGKSTLVNQLIGADTQATGSVRESDQRGRHTTTARELIVLPGGGVLIDTPGLRSVALWGSEEGFSRVFDDVEALVAQCRFADCSHRVEPGCAIQAAIACGDLDRERFEHYRKLDAELDTRR